MSEQIVNHKIADTAVKDICKFLLDSGEISGVFSLRITNKKGSVDYGLITDAQYFDDLIPIYPLMPVNAGQILGRFTPMKKPIAAIVHPCEFRAFIELVKREQGQMDNFLFITYSCGGVFPIKENALGNVQKNINQYWQTVQKSEIPDKIRPTCKGCEHIAPQNADIFISLIGEDADNCKIYLNTEKAQKLLNKFEGRKFDKEFDPGILKEILKARKEAGKKLSVDIDTSQTGLNGLIDIFGKCIGCHGCNAVCPICYCTLCDFDSLNYDYNTSILEKELEQKGALRLPPDTLFFHLGRLSHMSFSCVGCGQCSDVCPASIPVASIFKRTGENTAEMFDFVPGRDVNEKIPVMIYKEEEFPELGE